MTAGVAIGKYNLICANAVVTKNTPDYATSRTCDIPKWLRPCLLSFRPYGTQKSTIAKSATVVVNTHYRWDV